MGGFGSGNTTPRERKTTVEESLELGISDLRERIFDGSTDVIEWNQNPGRKARIRYLVELSESPRISFHYKLRNSEIVRIGIYLEKTPLHFGGYRWWFICPLVHGTKDCNRRSGKLYLPPGAKYFGCRICHDLTYRSCQMAHEDERFFERFNSMRKWLESQKIHEN